MIRFCTPRPAAATERHLGERVLASVGEIVAVCDADFTVRFVNDATCDFLGQGPSSLLGMNGMEFVHPDDRARAAAELAFCLAAPNSRACSEFRVETGAESWRTVAAVAVNRLDDPALRGVVISARDVSDRRSAEERIRESESLHRELFEQAADGIITATPNGQILEGNAAMCALSGYTHDELRTMRTMELYVAEEQELSRAALAAVARGEQFIAHRHLCRRDRSVVAVEVHARRLRDGRLHAIVRDVTCREARANRLHRSQRLEHLGLLAASIGHDFNNLLTVIISNAAEVAAALPSDSPEAEAIADVREAAKRGAAMVGRLSRGSNFDRLSLEPVDLNAQLGKSHRVLEKLLTEEFHLTVEIEPGLPLVIADETAVDECLLNLATNARDAMPLGGKLALSVRRASVGRHTAEHHVAMAAGEFIAVSVRDTGVGMDSATLSRAFEPYFTTKGRDEGTGLGLAMVYQLMKQQMGFVSIDSRPGEGTTVSLFFSVARDSQAESAR